MPTYEYKCDACGHAFEQFQSITAAPVQQCPVCGEMKVRRLISGGAGILFKGSGFYITDYRTDSYKSGQKSDAGGKSEGGEKGSGDKAAAGGDSKSSESKPAAEAKPAAAEAKASAPAKSEPKAEPKSPKKDG